ncbi:hypothetical protein HGRIS_010737 [Hohenbuehelia grisea]|uniref:Uncharacterized protein n=1 Tax=Hohenbuehelia grisea TaxID=104357 RepID=A0ABR3IY47_9AGAR
MPNIHTLPTSQDQQEADGTTGRRRPARRTGAKKLGGDKKPRNNEEMRERRLWGLEQRSAQAAAEAGLSTAAPMGAPEPEVEIPADEAPEPAEDEQAVGNGGAQGGDPNDDGGSSGDDGGRRGRGRGGE